MKHKISNVIFISIFMLILILPAVFINRKSEQISVIDNEILPEWPGFDARLSNIDSIEKYVNKRIGFREQMISSYIVLNDRLFHVMVHPLFMYGKQGHIFFKDDAYIRAYQRLNTDKEWLDSFTGFLKDTDAYLKSKDIKFLYYLCPDKKTIYSEYFPDCIHVNENNTPVIEYLENNLEKTEVEYIIPVDELLKAKQSEVVYNRLYDATHWNEDGAFLGHELIDEKVQEWFDDVPPLSKDDFERTMELKTSLDVSLFPIKEAVPAYEIRDDKSSNLTGLLYPYLNYSTLTFYSHFNNPQCGNNRKLLVFTDSYFGNFHKFYQNRFSEVYFVHRQNYAYLQYYVNLFFPDMVIFETAERSITGEMAGQADFNGLFYEPPYKGDLSSLRSGEDIGYTLENVSGLTLRDKDLLLNVNGGDEIVSIRGYLSPKEGSSSDYYVYAKIGEDAILECDYFALNYQTDPSLSREFSVNVQRRYLMEEEISLIAVNRNTEEEYLIDTFEVRYDQ
ncbi:MAG: hypothetical protein K5886_12890 [Lachnospiraceae bacterium]|nr:hypothetical protein [Lachnospiraceae bacterium]